MFYLTFLNRLKKYRQSAASKFYLLIYVFIFVLPLLVFNGHSCICFLVGFEYKNIYLILNLIFTFENRTILDSQNKSMLRLIKFCTHLSITFFCVTTMLIKLGKFSNQVKYFLLFTFSPFVFLLKHDFYKQPRIH